MVTATVGAIRRTLWVAAGAGVVLAGLYLGLAIHYWIAWPAGVR